MGNYTVYHLHDDTSNCNGYADSCSSYKEYIKLAKNQGMTSISFSNHGGIYDWVKKKQDCDKAKIKYIHGTELYLCEKFEDNERGYHVCLYAKNWDGVKELNTLLSLATSKGKLEDNSDRHFYYNPRISLDELMNTSNNIIITSACLYSILWIKRDDKELVNKILNWMSINSERCFLEIQYHNCDDQKLYNKLLYKWSNQYNIPLIAGTDTHSSSAYKAECRKILQKSKDSYYGDEDSFDLTWKTYDELVKAFKIQNVLPEETYLQAIENTNKFADIIEDFTLNKSFKYPNLYGENAIKIWQDTIVKKFNYKKKNKIIDITKIKEYKAKIKEEFEVMSKQNMESFMLFMSELTNYCNENNIPYGPCRGSVGGSVIAYITDITDVDPIKWKTIFSRFCNADRISLPDIDIDFAPEDRVKIYEFIMNKFTYEKTSYIAAFSTLKDRGTIDVLAKGLDYANLDEVMEIKNIFDKIFDEYLKIIQEEVNLEELDEIEARSVDMDYHDIYCNKIRNNKAITRINNLKKDFEKLKESNKNLFYYFDGLKGTIVAKGQHPAGMIGSPITLIDNLGVFYKNGDESHPVSICAMKAVDSLNYVKFDILGLKTIGIIKDAYNYINSHYLKSHEIDWDDKKVWDNMIVSSTGIFQFDNGDYAFSLLKDFKPRFINDMSLVNAALRPSGKSYRDRLIAGEINKNPSEQIDKLLKENNGFLVFQEDTIKFLTDICGFSGSDGDTIRRYIGKKMINELNESLPKILDGYCNNSNQPREIAEQEAKQFLQIIDDSSEYQFNYNHSTGYSMIGYICARLRTYYPLEFVAAYLNRAEKKEDIIKGVDLINQLGFTLKSIQFGKSLSEYVIDKKDKTIYKGILSIKYCNTKIATELYELAQKKKYTNFIDLLIDVQETSVDSRQLKILTGLNFFSDFGKNKKLLQGIELFNNLANRKQIGKKDIEKLNINEELLMQYCNKITEKTYKELDMIGYVKIIFETIDDKPMSIKEQVKFEKEYLEYVVYINPKAPETFYIISEYKTYADTSKPYISLYNLNTGDIIKTKIKDKKIYEQQPFKLYDILKVKKFDIQKKTKCINGKWQKTNEDEEILTEYEIY